MKSVAVVLLVVVLSALIIQPLMETSNVLKEKILLDSAILNACRSARNNSLVYENLSDLDGFADEDAFREEFSVAFRDTLELAGPVIYGNIMSFDSPSLRWNRIDVEIHVSPYVYDDVEVAEDFEGHGMSIAVVEVKTPYVFRTGLLSAVVGESGHSFIITQKRSFIVQIIN